MINLLPLKIQCLEVLDTSSATKEQQEEMQALLSDLISSSLSALAHSTGLSDIEAMALLIIVLIDLMEIEE